MAKSKSKTKSKKATAKVDLSKVETPEPKTLSNKVLLETIEEMVANRAKENPKHPHVGVNEIASHMQEQGIECTPRDVRRKLQAIRKKSPEYEKGQKAARVTLPAEVSTNPFEKELVIEWADMNNREKGIEYLVAR